MSDEAVHMLKQHPWPGNVRKRENVIARAVALAETGMITPDDVRLTERSAPDTVYPSCPLLDRRRVPGQIS